MSFKIIHILFVIAMFSLQVSGQDKDCKKVSSSSFRKTICSSIEKNKAYLVKYQLQRRSGENSLAKVLGWTRAYYDCIICRDEPGFTGGSMLRKVVFDDALSVAFFLVYDAKVNMNAVERDGKTLLDWVQADTEKNFDAMFETENENDQVWMLKQININTRYFNLFRNNGAKLKQELGK